VEVKHKIKPKDENLAAASMSHPAYFNQYQLIYGLTGTIGTEQERIEVQKIYEVDSFDVPPHFPSQRKRLPLQICE
jgi:preprotein translocase subunit SecA